MTQKETLGNLISSDRFADHQPNYHRLIFLANAIAERLLALKTLKNVHQDIPAGKNSAEFLNNVLDRFQIRHSICPEDRRAIPRKGPTVVIANHPFGGIDGILLASILCSVRTDVKILANYFLGRIPEMRPLFFMVDPFGNKFSINKNRTALKKAVRWIRGGGLLMVFPAGEVSHFRWKTKKIEDPEWDKRVARLIRWTRARVVPAYFKGRNSLAFQAAGLIHPLLRTLMLPRELLQKQSTHIHLKIGSPIPYRRIAGITRDSDLTAYLRFRTYLLGNAFDRTPGFLNTPVIRRVARKSRQTIVAPKSTAGLTKEIDGLAQDQHLCVHGALHVYEAFAGQIPNTLQEIGRLREETFRKVGEGTGKSIDLDRFDQHYRHLFVWNSETHEVVGAYRLAATDDVLKRFGKEGFYTYTLFKYQTRLLSQMGPALEMSRSFVRPEYQKSYTPLLLLWKGIGQFVVRHPRYKILFGAVSITDEYSSYSRRLMASFLKSNSFLQDLSQLVRPRKPYRQKAIPELETTKAASWPEDIDELSSWISDIETDGKGVPILLKQYLKLGGKLLSFNIDPAFGNVLDGLIMVDLTATDPNLLKRYMQADGFATFMSYHQQQIPDLSPATSMPANA
ncbi:MAG: GNAT family N-acyltransferase [Desulfobacterales bacterium]